MQKERVRKARRDMKRIIGRICANCGVLADGHQDPWWDYLDRSLLNSKTGPRSGDWFLTFTGKQFWPLSPRVEDICIEDIAQALSHICRFGGHCKTFYSVAQHSVFVSRLVPKRLAFAALMHDAPEAYIGDMVRPLKYSTTEYRLVEGRLWRIIAQRFDLPFELPPSIKRADDIALMTERRDILRPSSLPWNVNAKPTTATIVPLAPAEACAEFLQRYRNLLHS